jgi:hypothetical protein
MTTTNTAAGTARVNDTDAVMNALATIMPSTLPALVFTSLAAVSVPTFSDRCHIVIDEDGLGTYRIERPLTATADLVGNPGSHHHRVRDAWSGQWVGGHMVQTSFDQTKTGRIIGYRVSVLHLWYGDYHPTGTDVALAQLAVDHAVAILTHEQDQARARTFPAAVARR